MIKNAYICNRRESRAAVGAEGPCDKDMRGFISYIILCGGMSLAATCLRAQQPWESMPPDKRQKVLSSHSLPEEVRRLCDDPFTEDGALIRRAVGYITARCKDRNRASLYISLFDMLHDSGRTDCGDDVMMLRLYPDRYLSMFEQCGDAAAACDMAYSAARYYVLAGREEEFPAELCGAIEKRARKHRQAYESFRRCAQQAMVSLAAGRRAVVDLTEPPRLSDLFIDITAEEFSAAADTSQRIGDGSAAPALSEEELCMSRELLLREGAEYRPAQIEGFPAAECMTCRDGSRIRAVFVDSSGSTTFCCPLFITPGGRIYAVDERTVTLAVIAPDGTVDMIGQTPLPQGRLSEIRCSDESLAVSIATETDGMRYSMLIPQ